MEAHRTKAVVGKNGSVVVRGIPFREGEPVEIIVLSRERSDVRQKDRYPLRGSVSRYEQPFESAAEDGSWDALGEAK